MDKTVLSIIMHLFIREELKLMGRSHPEIGNPGMLNDIRIRIQKLRSHCSHMSQRSLIHQQGKPVLLNDFHIVVEKKKITSLCQGSTFITHPGKIECHGFILISHTPEPFSTYLFPI